MEGWMDENFIKNIFQTVLAESVQVKVIRDRNSGYVFSDFCCILFATLGTFCGIFADFFFFFSLIFFLLENLWLARGSLCLPKASSLSEVLCICEEFSILARG